MSIVTVTLSAPGTATMADSTALAIAAQTLANEKLWGSAGLLDPLSPISVMREQADALSDIANMLSAISKKQKDIEGALTSIRGSVSNVSAGVHAGVTTAQIAVTDQINNNKFNQTTTNAALERADLPPTTVTAGDLSKTTQSTIQNVTEFKGQVYAANLVEEQISRAATWTSDIVGDIIKDSFIGSAAKSISTTVKGWFAKEKLPEVAVELKSQKRSVKMLSEPIPPNPFENIG
jgi:hypothetical protein